MNAGTTWLLPVITAVCAAFSVLMFFQYNRDERWRTFGNTLLGMSRFPVKNRGMFIVGALFFLFMTIIGWLIFSHESQKDDLECKDNSSSSELER